MFKMQEIYTLESRHKHMLKSTYKSAQIS